MPTETPRASPDALLALAKKEGRGRLKIFLGAAPGVGKTYAMLTAARAEKAGGRDVVVGLVETHGRARDRGADRRPRGPAAQVRSSTAARSCRSSTSTPRWRAARACCWSTNTPTPMCRAAAIRSAGRISRNCWRPASTSGPR